MNRSRSTLFLIEQLIVIAVFAICAAVCVAILTNSYIMAGNSRKKSGALRAAQNAAECYKASYGDTAAAAAILNGNSNGTPIYYDDNWRICGETGAVYALAFTDSSADTGVLSQCRITVSETGGAEIISLTIAARRYAD